MGWHAEAEALFFENLGDARRAHPNSGFAIQVLRQPPESPHGGAVSESQRQRLDRPNN
jgi:hypothetical protein